MKHLAACLLVLALAVTSLADDTPPLETAAETKKWEELICVNFPNEDLRTALQNVATLYDLTLSLPPNFEGRISIKLRNVTWQQFFRQSLRDTGFTFEVVGHHVRVIPISPGSLSQRPQTRSDQPPPMIPSDGDKGIRIDMADTELRTALRMIGDMFELNLCVPLELQGEVKIHESNATWRRLFTEILTPRGYTFEEDGNIVNIVPMHDQQSR